jgi:hypothetical protein
MVYSEAWGKLIHGKNRKSKISRHWCTFNAERLLDFSSISIFLSHNLGEQTLLYPAGSGVAKVGKQQQKIMF